jgi:hypothetical protein
MVRRGLFVALGLLLLARVARADDSNTDIARLTMGSPVFPSGAWAIELTPIYSMHNWTHPSKDTLQPDLSVVHAFTERLSLAVAYEGLDNPRDTFRPAEVNVEGRYLLLEAPFMLAPYVLVGVPFENQPFNALVGAQALKNLGNFALRVIAEGEGYQALNGVNLHGDFEGGGFYRFGINGVIGATLQYRTDEGLSINPVVGGRVSPNIFLAMQPSVGLTHGAPDFELLLQLTFYFGPFRAMGLE